MLHTDPATAYFLNMKFFLGDTINKPSDHYFGEMIK